METPLIAHRCGRAYGPDSSRQALRSALAGSTVRGVETDVCLTRDGALACLHEAYLPLGTTLTGWAHERTAADVLAGRLLDSEGKATKERPLLVDEMLDLVPPRLTVQLDVKAHADAVMARRTVDALAAVLARRPDGGRVEVLSFHAAAVKQAVRRGLTGRLVVWADYAPAGLARWAADLALRGVCVEHFLLGEALVAALRDAGLSVTTGTVNHAAIAERALAHSPDALTTDRPHQLAAELAERRRLAPDSAPSSVPMIRGRQRSRGRRAGPAPALAQRTDQRVSRRDRVSRALPLRPAGGAPGAELSIALCGATGATGPALDTHRLCTEASVGIVAPGDDGRRVDLQVVELREV